MRGQRCCPACGGQKIHYSESVLDRSDSGRMKMALLQPSVWRVKGAGQFETYICAGCGLVEWYVQNPESLAEHLDLLEHPSPQNDGGPYR